MMRPLALAASLTLAACAVGPDYQPPKITSPGEAWRRDLSAGLENKREDLARWWTRFGAAELDALVARALDENLSLKQAGERLEQARALRGAAGAARFPQVESRSFYTRQEIGAKALEAQAQGFGGGGGSFRPDFQDTYFGYSQVGVQAAWELDLFGRVRRLVEAADADIEASVEAYRGLLVALLADIAAAYIDLREFEARLRVLDDNIALQRSAKELAEVRVKAGMAPELELALARSLLATTRARRPELRRLQAVTRHRLAVLTGRRPGAELGIGRGLLPPMPAEIGLGLPADLLTRRPDVRQAERALAAATARIGAAQGERYPRLSIDGTLALRAQDLGEIVGSPARALSFGPSLTIPLFDGGRLAAQVRRRRSERDEALFRLEQTVLRALEEAENAIVGLTEGVRRRDELEEAVAAARRSAELSQQLYSAGGASFLVVIDAQRELARLESDAIQARSEALRRCVALYRALGGGWQAQPLEAVDETEDS